jgi:hypothetical protein
MTKPLDYFVLDNEVEGTLKEFRSPSGAYTLVTRQYATTKPGWRYCLGQVFDASGHLCAEVRRNYPSFPFAWVENHPDGHDYLVCGETYTSHTAVCLDEDFSVTWTENPDQPSWGFCWASIHPNASGDLVAVEGCYWGGPYEVRVYDFSNPRLPTWKLLMRSEDCAEEFICWDDDTSLTYGLRYEKSKIFNKSYYFLTTEEDDEMERLQKLHPYSELWEEVSKVHTVKIEVESK